VGQALHSDPPFIPPSRLRGGQHYRLYFFNDLGGIAKCHEFFADDDAAAIRISEAWREGRGMELWRRDRRVETWESD
jgi:hypothetical protein